MDPAGCPDSQCDVAVIGGGCSGALVAARLLAFDSACRVIVIEPRAELGRGLAYSTPYDEHLLNVPAGKMSAFAEVPSHFVDWLRSHGHSDAGPGMFAPRKVYGAYLEDVLTEAIRRPGALGRFRHVRAEVSDISMNEESVELRLNDGSTLEALQVVLALGNPASSPHLDAGAPVGLEGKWHASPWTENALRLRVADERILLLGTGLTSVDSAMALLGQSKESRVSMVSRRGVISQAHQPTAAVGRPPESPIPLSLRQLLREVRAEVGRLAADGSCWRAAIDALRPASNRLWNELSASDRRRFLRHVKTYWENHRHRMAPEIWSRIDGYRNEGRIDVIAGRLGKLAPAGTEIHANLLLRGGDRQVLEVDRVICCTGIQEDYTRTPRPLIRAVLSAGIGQANEVGIGFRTDEHGALLDPALRPSRMLFTLGPPRRGDLFETTAVPEIRAQAEALARHLIAVRHSSQRTGSAALAASVV